MRKIMEKLTFLMTIVISLLPISYSSNVHTIPAKECMFGPFKDTFLNCFLQNGKVDGCLLQGFNWFSDGSPEENLSERKVLDAFALNVKNEKYRARVDALVRGCVGQANLYGSNRNQTSDNLVACFDADQSFNDIFPEAFCEEEELESINFPEYSKIKTVVVNCALGPFQKNSKKCNSSNGVLSSCLLNDLGLLTEDHRVDGTKLLESIDSHIINSEYKGDIDAVMRKCVTHANAILGTDTEVGDELVSCWRSENAFLLFVGAFCPKSNN